MKEDTILQISVSFAPDNKFVVTVDKRPEDVLAFLGALRELAAVSKNLALTEAAQINRKMYGFESKDK